jgi:hypothetical protein
MRMAATSGHTLDTGDTQTGGPVWLQCPKGFSLTYAPGGCSPWTLFLVHREASLYYEFGVKHGRKMHESWCGASLSRRP